jgi:alpha-tubulin suppressor-like RCC1 family protein
MSCLGEAMTAVVGVTGKLSTFGSGEHGILGHGDREDQCIPVIVRGPLTALKVSVASAGRHHCLCITDDGSLYSWGGAAKGQLGHGDSAARLEPARVEALSAAGHVVQCGCGVEHSAALTSSGHLYTWGLNSFGQLGVGDLRNRPLPTHLDHPAVYDPSDPNGVVVERSLGT